MGRVIITIDEIIAGRGLVSNRDTFPPSIEVFCGNGLSYGDDNDLAINVGPGLGFADKIKSPNTEGMIDVPVAGPALMVLNTELAGFGLSPGPGSQIDIDTEPDSEQEQTFRVVTDTKFQMDGYRLVFATTHTTFIVHRNHAGVVLGIEEGDSVVELQPLNIDGYGYGNAITSVPVSDNPTHQPSFYKS